jgi:hypothetical protein
MGAFIAGILSDLFQAMNIAEPLTWSLICIDLLGLFTIASFIIASIHWNRQHATPDLDRMPSVRT